MGMHDVIIMEKKSVFFGVLIQNPFVEQKVAFFFKSELSVIALGPNMVANILSTDAIWSHKKFPCNFDTNKNTPNNKTFLGEGCMKSVTSRRILITFRSGYQNNLLN